MSHSTTSRALRGVFFQDDLHRHPSISGSPAQATVSLSFLTSWAMASRSWTASEGERALKAQVSQRFFMVVSGGILADGGRVRHPFSGEQVAGDRDPTPVQRSGVSG